MNKVAIQRPSRPLLSDLAELFETLPAFAALRPLFDGRTIRVEDELFEEAYEIRAELPGVDPEQDIEVTVRDGRLTITAQRPGPGEGCGRSEFQYGSFSRSLSLPDGADQDEVNATYDRGILTVSVPLTDENRPERHVEVIEVVSVDDDDDDDDAYDDDDADDDDIAHVDGADGQADQHEPVHQG